ncbi:PLP-dependent aminotransferase family protein [Candidatus Woesearchaeota archaeon]|nr:PLP-dependent aminotransferase family protein [Candidatus Woesearchaeota archaeon]
MDNISFASGSLGEVQVLEEVLGKALSKIDPKSLLNYSHPLGIIELREQIAKLYGGSLLAENVMITSSAQQALVITFNNLLNSGMCEIAAQEPAYFGVLRILGKDTSLKVTPFESIDRVIESTESGIVYLTSNFHNPTGKTLTKEEKSRLAQSVKVSNSVIVEDNPHDFLYFNGERPRNVFEFAPNNTIYVGGFSKILAPGLRIGYVIANQETIQKLKSAKIDQDIFTSSVGQQVCVNVLRSPEYLNELRGYFKEKRDLALQTLDEHFSEQEGFSWSKPEGGIFILGQFAPSLDGTEVARIAKEKYGLTLEKDKHTYADEKTRNTTRINFVQNPDNVLREGISRLYKSFIEVKNGS